MTCQVELDLGKGKGKKGKEREKGEGEKDLTKNTYVATHVNILKVYRAKTKNHLKSRCGQERLERIDRSDDPRRQAVEQV